MSTDQHWEAWGARDPYFGVITQPQFRRGAMDEAAREAFFALGDWHLQCVMGLVHRALDPHFRPRRALDFGCGVGRVLVPLSRQADEVLGLDISPSMLAEARRNCDERGAGERVQLALSDDDLGAAAGDFDFVHSCIVLQHIETERGRRIFRRLVDKLAPGGIGALHLTYAMADFSDNEGRPPAPPPPPPPPTAWQAARARLRLWIKGPPPPPPAPATPADADPEMQMNWYDLNQVFWILQSSGMHQVYVDFSDHGGAWGVFLCFRRPGPA